MHRRHALLSVCLAAVLVALAVWLLDDDAVSTALPPRARIAPEDDSPAARTEGPGQAEHREPRAEAPHLVGREPVASEGALGGDVTVVVVGPSGKPVADVPVYASRSWQEKVNPASADRWIPGPPTHQRGNIQVPTVWETVEEQVFAGRTNEAGRVEMPDILLDGSTSVRLACGGVQGKPVTSTRCELRIDTLLPFTTEIVDASTGTCVEADWRFLGRGWQRTDGKAATWVGGPGPWDPTIYVTAPHGWVAWDPTTTKAHVSPAAKALVYRYPLRREVDVVVEVEDRNGFPAALPEVVRCDLAGLEEDDVKQEVLPGGRVRVDGMPLLPGATLQVLALDRGLEPDAVPEAFRVRGRLPLAGRGPLVLRVRVGAAPLASAPAAGGSRDTVVLVAGASRDPDRADLRVRVLDERGRGLPFALARLASDQHRCPPTWIDEVEGVQRLDPFTDHQGARTWHGLEPGTWSVRATWAGHKAHTTLQLEAGRLVEVEVCPAAHK